MEFTALAIGTKVYTIGTGYEAEVIASEVVQSRFLGRVVRNTVRYTKTVYGAVDAGETDTYLQIPGRTARFVVGAGQ